MTPLVLIHGVGLDRSMWDDFAGASTRSTVAYDTLGHGEAVTRRGPYRLDDYVAQFDAEAPQGRVDIAGFSMGALIGLALAIALPHRVRRLVLVSAVHDRTLDQQQAIEARVADVRCGGYPASIEPALDRWFTPTFAATRPQAVQRVRARLLANDPGTYADAYEVFATADREVAPHVPRITAPVLCVTGGDDQRSTPAMTLTLAGRIPRGHAEIVAGVRHMVPIEAAAALAAMVDEFLEERDG